jgi:hypothetical protein
MTYEERCAEHARETAEAKDQRCGSVSVGTQVVHEGNAASGEIVNGVATKRSWEEKTSPGGWEGAPAPERKRPASNEKSGVIVPRRR